MQSLPNKLFIVSGGTEVSLFVSLRTLLICFSQYVEELWTAVAISIYRSIYFILFCIVGVDRVVYDVYSFTDKSYLNIQCYTGTKVFPYEQKVGPLVWYVVLSFIGEV